MTDKNGKSLNSLTALMERLRGPGGCPWDREQTLKSLTPFIIEEAYEVVSAIDSGTMASIKEELGDLLFQVIFACQIAKEDGRFDITNVMDCTVEKMIRRHPHVFGDKVATTSEEVLKHWAEIKKEEKKSSEKKQYLSDVPEAMPALLRAHKVSQKAAKAGFDWKEVDEVLNKLREETDEFKKALHDKDAAGMEEELGDMLFTIVNVGRFVDVNPEDALRKTIGKFMNRFHYVEKIITQKGGDLSSTPMEEMERLWEESKLRKKE